MRVFQNMKIFLIWVLLLLSISGCASLSAQRRTTTFASTSFSFIAPMNYSLSELNELNPDTIGIITIEGLLEQPIVKSENNVDYLYIDFNLKESLAGANFMDYNSHLDSQNMIVYGHSSANPNSLFSPLIKYLDSSFFYQNSTIQFENKEHTHQYEIFSVYLFDVTQAQRNDGFMTTWYNDFLFRQALKQMSANSLHKKEIDINQISQVITLVTCHQDNLNERIIIHAYRINE